MSARERFDLNTILKKEEKRTTGLRVEVREVTPKLAEEWLKLNVYNFRRIDEKTVKRYARRMRDGLWKVSVSAIAFDPKGFLVNGQHTLLAVVKTGIPITAIVAKGFDNYYEVDNGRTRTVTAYLAEMGCKDAGSTATALRYLWAYKNVGLDKVKHGYTIDVTVTELVELFERNKGIADSVSLARMCSHIMTRSVLGFIHYVASESYPEEADDFILGIRETTDDDQEDPRFCLKRYMLARKDPIRSRIISVKNHVMLSLGVKAWNYFVTGMPCKKMRWRASDRFPHFELDV
jgi:hypothetical protein